MPRPKILDEHRKAPDWDSMSMEKQNEHWQEIQRQYLKPLDELPRVSQDHKDEVLDVVRLNTPPLLMDRMSP